MSTTDEDLQALAELHRSSAQMFQGALGDLTIVAGHLTSMARAATGPDTRTLDERIAAVQLELEDVPRKGHAEVTTKAGAKYTYDYITEADLMTGVRPLLAKHGIAVYYSDRIVEISAGMARVEVTWLLRAAGEQIVLTAEGLGTDTGDKAANKAKTSAMRYLLWKTFLQPSDEDPEQENVSAQEAAGAHQGRQAAHEQRQTARTPRRGAQTPEQRKAGLIQRIVQLALELDEVQGARPGATQGKLYADIENAHGIPAPQLDEQALVDLGKALADHVTGQRQIAEKGGDASDAFEIPNAG